MSTEIEKATAIAMPHDAKTPIAVDTNNKKTTFNTLNKAESLINANFERRLLTNTLPKKTVNVITTVEIINNPMNDVSDLR